MDDDEPRSTNPNYQAHSVGGEKNQTQGSWDLEYRKGAEDGIISWRKISEEKRCKDPELGYHEPQEYT